MASKHFLDYVANINRIHLVELIEDCSLDHRRRAFRASLIENPVTGLPYAAPEFAAIAHLPAG